MACVVKLTVAALLVTAGVSGDETWVWGQSRKASSIPGYVEPTTTTTTTTTTSAPLTFRPVYSLEQHGGRGSVRTASANPYFIMMVGGSNQQGTDGTTKSRVVVDTAFDENGPEPLVLGDTYTTVDRLQRTRGAPPRFPRPQIHQLGGLHPDEVFYANDDLLITRGGGFHSEVFEEPSQLLHEDDVTNEDVSGAVPDILLPPSHDQEYNGNIPVIVPPPAQTQNKPISFLVGTSQRNYMMVPYVYPRTYRNTHRRQHPSRYTYRHRYNPRPAALQAISPVQIPVSLAGDTDVNFLHPRPAINPDAEVFVPSRRGWRRRNL